jgi:hypothetical protein
LSCSGFYRVLNAYAEWLRIEREFKKKLRRHILKHYTKRTSF